LYETTALQLLRDEGDGRLAIKAAAPDAKLITLTGKAIVLASGGYEGNPEMLTQYLGGNARYIRPVARGGYYNKGEGIRMALNAGAAPAGDFSSDRKSTRLNSSHVAISY